MPQPQPYLFTSERLGFRSWEEADLPVLAALNADPEVMAHFPKTLSKEESLAFIHRMQGQQAAHGYQYFATEIRETGELIGFIGLAYQEYASPFTPATDIGWRLLRSAWGKGYASEGARRCLEFAFYDLGLPQVIAVCTRANVRSEAVMNRIGMEKIGEFLHPKLECFPEFQECLCYGIGPDERLLQS